MITVKINVSRIDKQYLYKGKNGTYLDLVLIDNKNGPDQYGNDFMVVQGLPKEVRDSGKRGEILGNGKSFGGNPKPKPTANKPAPSATEDDDGDDVPF